MDLLALGDVASGNMSGISDSSKIHLSAGYQWVKVIENRVQALVRKVMTRQEDASRKVVGSNAGAGKGFFPIKSLLK